MRPVVVQPQQPSPPPVRSLPRNATAMPLGLSANSVGLGIGGGLNTRKILFIGIPITVVLALALGTWLFVRSFAPLNIHTITNSAYEYSFLFYRSSESVNLVAGEGLKYDSKALVIAKPTNDDVVKSCDEMGSKWKEAFTVQVEGVEHPVCRFNDNVFLVTFFHGKAKHLLEITYTTPHAINVNDVRQIVQSLRVSLP